MKFTVAIAAALIVAEVAAYAQSPAEKLATADFMDCAGKVYDHYRKLDDQKLPPERVADRFLAECPEIVARYTKEFRRATPRSAETMVVEAARRAVQQLREVMLESDAESKTFTKSIDKESDAPRAAVANCMLENAKRLDDGVASAESVATAIYTVCARTLDPLWEVYRKAGFTRKEVQDQAREGALTIVLIARADARKAGAR